MSEDITTAMLDSAMDTMVAMSKQVIAGKSRFIDEAHWGYNNVEEFSYHARPGVIVALAKELARLRDAAAWAKAHLDALTAFESMAPGRQRDEMRCTVEDMRDRLRDSLTPRKAQP